MVGIVGLLFWVVTSMQLTASFSASSWRLRLLQELLVGSSEGERATCEMLSDDDGAFLISTLSREEPEGGEQVGELYTVEVRGEKLLSYNYYGVYYWRQQQR